MRKKLINEVDLKFNYFIRCFTSVSPVCMPHIYIYIETMIFRHVIPNGILIGCQTEISDSEHNG